MTCPAGSAEGHFASTLALQSSLLMPAAGQGIPRMYQLATGADLWQAALQSEQSSN